MTNRNIKILVKSMIKWDATSFYRAHGILPNLDKIMGRQLSIASFGGGQFTWAELGYIDIAFFQRPAKQEDLRLAEYCKDLGIKVWVDYDDNLFTLPNESRGYFEYGPAVQKTMLEMLLLADAVTVSTGELKNFFEGMGIQNVQVVPNALNDDWIIPAKEFNKDSNKILWRGSETHWFDLVAFSNELYDAMSLSNDQWHFIGYNPATLTNSELASKIFLHKGEDVMVYNANLQKLKPKLMHVPLVDNQLNKAKSNIAWIEATYAGAVCIAPNWPEWRKPGIITYDSPEEYKQLLLDQKHDYAKCWKDSMDYINENLLLSKVNLQRKEIIETLLA